jgi:branched-chain amino acid aminotransferase
MVWCDGKFLKEDEFKVSPFDRGLCHGFSFFETILAVDGRPRLLTEHLDRLRQGLERLGVLSVELSDSGLENVIVTLLEKNELSLGMARVRFAVSLGSGPINLTDSGATWAWMTATRVEADDIPLRLTSAPWRYSRESVLRGLKVGNYAEHLIAMDMARREGFDEMLFYNTSDELCEAAMANVFLIKGKALMTPSLDSGCLAGVTRRHVMAIARELGIACREKPLGHNDVKKADCLFLTSSIRGPVRVGVFNGESYAENPIFDSIRSAWLNAMAG